MSKEIIIDGVNVAGCVQLVEEPFYHCGLGGECKGWENCYYKQLKRLEQENAKLKQDIEAYKQSEQEATEIIAELKAENEQLKALCDTYRTCYQAKHSDIKCLFIKYKQTLQEIKAIAEFHITQADSEDIQNDMKQIIDLITKVEGKNGK